MYRKPNTQGLVLRNCDIQEQSTSRVTWHTARYEVQPGVDYVPNTALTEVFYSTYTTSSYDHTFMATVNTVGYPQDILIPIISSIITAVNSHSLPQNLSLVTEKQKIVILKILPM